MPLASAIPLEMVGTLKLTYQIVPVSNIGRTPEGRLGVLKRRLELSHR